MKIVMHCLYFPPEIGGLESHVYYLCKGLVEAGSEVSIVTSSSQEGLPEQEIVQGIKVYRTWLPQKNRLGWTVHALASIPRLAQVAVDADIIHGQSFQSVLPSYIAKKINEIPMVTSWHTSHFLTQANQPSWRINFRKFLQSADHNFAASTQIADVAQNISPELTVEPISNGVDTEVFTSTIDQNVNDKPIILIVPRRLYKKNGVEFFIRAMPLITQAVDAKAIIVGDGPERVKLENLSLMLGMASKIDFLGSRNHEDMPDLFNSAHLAILPSLMEATSVAALEAMACGIPVAASRVGGLPELIGEDVGGLFRPRDSRSLAETVLTLLSRRDFLTLGNNARQRVLKNWTNAHLVERHLEVYESLIKGNS